MPGGVTPARRLTTFEGAPTTLARAGVVMLMAIAAVIGWVAGPDREDSRAPARDVVSIHRLSGDLPPAPAETRLTLARAAALPRIQGAGPRAPASAATPEPAVTPSATPVPPASAKPTPTPGATVVPVVTPQEPASAPAPAPAPPRPAATPAPTFDSSG